MQKLPKLWANFFPWKKFCINYENWSGPCFGRFFSHTHLVTLMTSSFSLRRLTARVTTLDEFSPLCYYLLWVSIPHFWATFSAVKVLHLILTIMVWATFWATFCTNSSGHPVNGKSLFTDFNIPIQGRSFFITGLLVLFPIPSYGLVSPGFASLGSHFAKRIMSLNINYRGSMLDLLF
jgi:hypothetical protein